MRSLSRGVQFVMKIVLFFSKLDIFRNVRM